jgi:hypothetical protein
MLRPPREFGVVHAGERPNLSGYIECGIGYSVPNTLVLGNAARFFHRRGTSADMDLSLISIQRNAGIAARSAHRNAYYPHPYSIRTAAIGSAAAARRAGM